MSRIAIFPSSSNLTIPTTYNEYEGQWISATQFIKWLCVMENINFLPPHPVGDLIKYLTEGPDDQDAISMAEGYLYYIDRDPIYCQYRIFRAEARGPLPDGSHTLNSVEVFDNKGWTARYKSAAKEVCDMAENTHHSFSAAPVEVDDSEYMKVIGYGD